MPPLESFLRQAKDEVTGLNEGYRQLESNPPEFGNGKLTLSGHDPRHTSRAAGGALMTSFGDAGSVPRSDRDFWGVRVDEVT